jgi:hypothetical protein
MGELRLIKPDGTDITFHADDTVTIVKQPRRMEQCDNCSKYGLESEGIAYPDDHAEVIMWFCSKCIVLNKQ